MDKGGLITLLVNILSTLTLFNAVYGVSRYNELAFPPNCPSVLRGNIIRNRVCILSQLPLCQFKSRQCRFIYLRNVEFFSKTLVKFQHPRREDEITAHLPQKETTLKFLSVIRLLSTKPSRWDDCSDLTSRIPPISTPSDIFNRHSSRWRLLKAKKEQQYSVRSIFTLTNGYLFLII